MAKKLIDDSKHDSFVDRNWAEYQKAQKAASGKSTKKTTKKKTTKKK